MYIKGWVKVPQILALGDCNTLGIDNVKGNAYPELFAKEIDKTVLNCGFTMSTTREMKYFFNDYKDNEIEIILIQYGLVDSWKTFKYAPYVLYYPDNGIRKFCRKIVKKYKKITKKIGLNKLLGISNVVDLEEYESNIESIIHQAKNRIIFLIDTVPNLDTSRNIEIIRYNHILSQLSRKYKHVHYIEAYNDFIGKTKYYLEATHLNRLGNIVIAQKILSVYCQIIQNNKGK